MARTRDRSRARRKREWLVAPFGILLAVFALSLNLSMVLPLSAMSAPVTVPAMWWLSRRAGEATRALLVVTATLTMAMVGVTLISLLDAEPNWPTWVGGISAAGPTIAIFGLPIPVNGANEGDGSDG